jgi:3-oxoacyl-[acyl-carrier protein] reductase
MNKDLSDDDLVSIKNEIPLEKIGSPKDVANLVLAIDKNNYITGQVIQINGGWYI